MKLTRRELALGITAMAAVPAGAQTPPSDPNAAARDAIRKNSQALAKVELPIDTEPAFQFKA